MKKLFIIRHAKSSWKDMSVSDFDRPLNNRGKKNAPFMGKLLKSKNISPDLIISSPAKRASETAKAFAKELHIKDRLTFNSELYGAFGEEILEIIKDVDDEVETLFIVAHNPSVNEVANILVGFDDNIVTAGVVGIEFDSKKWKEVDSTNAKFILFEYPKKYE